MKIEIKPLKINKDPQNKVTSSNIFKKNQRKVSNVYKYDENGLFSRRIFGRVGHCDCGALTSPGYCEECDCRVVDPNNMPDFYIDLGIEVPKLFADFGPYREVKDVLEFGSFVYQYEDGSTTIFKDDENDATICTLDPSRIHIGLDGASLIYPDIKEWAEKYMTDFIVVPHTSQRPNIKLNNDKVQFSYINKTLVDILKNIERVKQYEFLFKGDADGIAYYLMSYYKEIYEDYKIGMNEVFNLFAGGKSSFINSNLKGHRVSGAIKGTVTNRFDIDEDVVLIGDTFIKTLYPFLYKKYQGDMEKINDHLVEHDEMVLMNRPPTICHLSIAGLKPRVASCYKLGTFNDGALGKGHQVDYDDESDTLGIRTIGMNPVITDGYAGDFDGDTYLVIALYSEEAKEEARKMAPSKNYMNYPNGTIRNVVPEDIVFANSGIMSVTGDEPRDEYMDKCYQMAANTFANEKLPFVTDVMNFALNNEKSPRLQRVFDFFGDEEEIKSMVSCPSAFMDSAASAKFIEKVISANITDITQSGLLYKQLQALGDSYRITIDDCGSHGAEIPLPIDEETFDYRVKDCLASFDENDKDAYVYYTSYEEFAKEAKGHQSVFVRTPNSCHKRHNGSCCKACAGKVPEGTQNLGAFATLMITEFATQAALSSMNKGKKENVNHLLAKSGAGITTEKQFDEWAEGILNALQGGSVERRFYEIALIGRMNVLDDGKVKVSSIRGPESDNYLGEFIFRPKEKTFKKMVKASSFFDDSLKAQIAMNQYKSGLI